MVVSDGVLLSDSVVSFLIVYLCVRDLNFPHRRFIIV